MARTIQILITAEDKASGAFQRVSESAGGLQSSLTGVLTVAGGMLVSRAIEATTAFLTGLGRQALESVGNVQNLEIAMEGLLTQSLMYQKVNEVRQEAVGLTEEEAQKLAKLGASLDVQNAKMQEQRERIRQMSEEWTDSGLNVQTARARLAEMELQAASTQSEIERLTQKQGEYSTVTSESWQKTMDFAEAQGLAKDQARDLLSFVNKLAIVSPFETSQVELVTKLGLGAKFTTDEVKKLVPAFLDYSAVVGITSENLAFAFDQFAQLRKIGKLTEIDMRQLRRLGIDIAQVLGVEMDMSVEEFNEQVEQSPELMDKLFESFVKFAGETTAGAAQRMATTVTGMMSTAHDIVDIGSRNLFRPIIEAVSPMASDLLSQLADAVTGPELTQVGQNLADGIMNGLRAALGKGQELVGAAKTGGLAGVGGVILADLQAAWPGIQAELTSWGERFWDWLNETALPLAQEKLAAIGTEIEKAWPLVREKLADWGNQSWDWIQTDAIPVAQEKLAAIGTEIEKAWPGIQAKLAEWGAQFWDWIQTNAIPLAQEKLAAIGTEIEKAWPGIQAKLAEWGAQFWDWLKTTAVPQAKTKLDELAVKIVEWSEDPATSAKMNSLGETIGKAMVDGIVGAAVGSYLTLKAGDTLKNLPESIAETTANVGSDIASGIISGIGEKLSIDLASAFTTALSGLGVEDAKTWGTRLAEALEAGFEEGLKTALALLNPVAFVRQQVSNIGGGIQSARELGQQLAGEGGFSLTSLLGLEGEGVAQDAGNAAGRLTNSLREALPDAISESGLGRQFLGTMSDEIDGADDEKKALAQAIAGGLPDHVAREAGATGEAFLDALTTYVSLRLGFGAEARP